MKQTKKGSLLEVFTNIIIGYIINFTANMVVLPLFGFMVTFEQTFYIGLIFTLISVARSYTVRRIYNKYGWFCEEKPKCIRCNHNEPSYCANCSYELSIKTAKELTDETMMDLMERNGR